MRSQRERMLSGEPYRADDSELVAGRQACQRLLETHFQRFGTSLTDTLLGM